MSDSDAIIRMIEEGGVYYNISGTRPAEVFADVAPHLVLPAGVKSDALVSGLLERESLMTTAVGYGIALPHPRTPLVSNEKDERIYVCFLDQNVNFDAMDGKPVYVLFIILSCGSQSHLKALSRLSYLFQQESFRGVIRNKPDTQELISAIKTYL
jgi:PTS system nitrogen regulatory IIA component